MFFYTDVSQYKGNILLRGYKNGKRVRDVIKYKPYLFVPSKEETLYKNVRGQYIEKIDFENIWDAKKFIKDYRDVTNFKIYGMDKFVYTYISDTFTGNIKYDTDKIKIMYIDIEVDSQDGFPDIELANKHINAITFRIGNIRTVLGLKEFDKKKLTRIKDIDNVFYYQFDTEEDLLRNFLKLWKAADPDVVTGWNIEFFDIPYIVRRLRLVLSEAEANSISPWNRLTERQVSIRGKDHTVYFPVGIAILDYLQLYKKFTYSQRESYSLNYIAHTELGVAKVNTGGSLAELYRTNHQGFIEYNIVDVDLIVQLEDKLRLIELVFAMAYDAKVNYNDTLGTVLLWDVIIMNYLKDKNIYIDPQKRKPWLPYDGGYVKEPVPGLYHWVMSFDLTSLYPHLIMQYNISPETFVKKISVPNISEIISEKNFPQIDGFSIAGNGCCYVKDKYGFLPALMDLQFKLREEFKQRMQEAEKRFEITNDPADKAEITRWDKKQHAKKIQLNSAYGALGNEWFRWYDQIHAEAITHSAQLSIRWILEAVNGYMKKLMGDDEDYIIACDTDSIYINFGPLIEKLKPNDPVTFLSKVGKEKLESFIEKKYKELAVLVNAYENQMKMKREIIADKAIWRAKKNYVANVWDKEGIRYKEPKLKFVGIEAVKSSTPEICRDKIKQAVKLIITTDEATVQEFIEKFKEEYYKLPFEDIAFPKSIKQMSKFYHAKNLYILGTPIHARASLLYNYQLKKLKLTKKYNPIYDADKVKYVYLKEPNPIMDNVIGAPGILPEEFGLSEYIDYDLMFSKSFLEPVKSMLDIIGWEPERRYTVMDFFR